jgi:hypothetical protein
MGTTAVGIGVGVTSACGVALVHPDTHNVISIHRFKMIIEGLGWMVFMGGPLYEYLRSGGRYELCPR